MTRGGAGGSKAAAAPEPANQPPQITQVNITGVDGFVVHVRRGQSYTVCRTGVRPTAAAPCEPGVIAFDPDGAKDATGGNTSIDLTAKVVVCPPAKCLTRGCSPMELQRHTLAVKGLQGCGIDLMAPEGTQFKVCGCLQHAYRYRTWQRLWQGMSAELLTQPEVIAE